MLLNKVIKSMILYKTKFLISSDSNVLHQNLNCMMVIINCVKV
jgi:hypothetical protein